MEQAFIWYNINFYKEEFIGFEAVNIKLTGFYYLIRIKIVKPAILSHKTYDTVRIGCQL